MAGGLGKRFWPVSTKACPKQFCDILNVGKSFLRQTFERANQIFDTRNIFIVTGSAYEELTPFLTHRHDVKIRSFGAVTARKAPAQTYKKR